MSALTLRKRNGRESTSRRGARPREALPTETAVAASLHPWVSPSTPRNAAHAASRRLSPSFPGAFSSSFDLRSDSRRGRLSVQL